MPGFPNLLPLVCVIALATSAGCSLKVDREKLAALEGLCDAGACGDAIACNSPECCQGCWDGVACLPGTSAAGCGLGGGLCQLCTAPTDACRQGQCVASRVLLSLAASGAHTCAADSNRNLWCWGSNAQGQLAVDETSVRAPEIVATGGWIAVAAGGSSPAHTCAIHFQGSLWCWGDNSRGQLGFSSLEVPQANRVRQVDAGGWADVSTGPLTTCAVRDEGTLWCWGAADDGRLGQGEVNGQSEKPSIVGVEADWRAVSVGDGFVCALKRDNTLYCWGRNNKGQVGRVGVGPVSARPVVVNANFLTVSAGASHACGVRVGGSVWCWGDNSSGQLGLPASQAFVETPQRVPFADETSVWTSVVVGKRHSCALTQQGSLWCWGANAVGQLGQGVASEGASLPVAVDPQRRWLRVAAGEQHMCAEAADGTLWCWGDGSLGQTGLSAPLTATPTLLPLR